MRAVHINTSVTTDVTLQTGSLLKSIVIGKPGTAWNIQILDGTTELSNYVATAPVSLQFGLRLVDKLHIVTTGATPGDMLVIVED